MSEKFSVGGLEIEVHERTELDDIDREALKAGEFNFERCRTSWTVNNVSEEANWPKASLVQNCMVQLPVEVRTERPLSWVMSKSNEYRLLVQIDGYVYAPDLIDAFYGKEVADYIRANRIKPYPAAVR